ncbi:sugar ABC transporter permease [Chloroflexi bacterium TSY]|nr:sugar ABC transporter permease [Chloroflexi bacterium TSY]
MIDQKQSIGSESGVEALALPYPRSQLGRFARLRLAIAETPEIRAYLMTDTRKSAMSMGAFIKNAPMLIALFLVSVIPIGYSFWISLQKYNLRQPNNIRFNYGENYLNVLTNTEFWQSMRVTFTFTVGSVIGQVIVGLLIALLLNEKFTGRGILRSAVLLPWAIAGVMWKWIFNPRFGVLNGLLYSFGAIDEYRSWVGVDPAMAMAALIFVQVWNALPFNTIVLLAALQAIPSDLYEAATVDRAGVWSRFRYITLPWLTQPIMIIMILATMTGLRVFDLVFVLTGGGPGDSTRVVTFTAWKKAFDGLDFGTANSYAYILTLITLIIGLIYIHLLYQRGEIEQ